MQALPECTSEDYMPTQSEHETPYRGFQRLIPGLKSNTVQTWRSNSCMHKPDLCKLQGAQGMATISSFDWQDRERHGEEWEHVTEGTVKRMKLVDKEGKLAKLVDDLCHELHPYSGYLIRWFWQHKRYSEVMKNPSSGSVITVRTRLCRFFFHVSCRTKSKQVTGDTVRLPNIPLYVHIFVPVISSLQHTRWSKYQTINDMTTMR